MENVKSEKEELDIQEIIEIIKDFLRYVWRKKFYIAFFSLFIALLFVLYAWLQPVNYVATQTFVVKEETQNGGMQLPSALAAFGFGNNSKSGLNMDKIVALSQSNRIVFNALMSPIVDDSTKIIANEIVRIYDLYSDEKPTIIPKEFEKLSYKEKSILRYLKKFILSPDNGIVDVNYNKNTEIMHISVTSRNQFLSISLVESLYHYLSSFYIEQSINKAEENVNALSLRLDSISNELENTELSYAKSLDRNAGLVYSIPKVDEYRMQRDLEIETQAYAEITKNLEIALFKLQSITPVFTIVDSPFLPLPKDYASKSTYGIMGLILGCILAMVFYIIKKAINKFLLK